MAQQALGNVVNGVAQLPSAWGSSPAAAPGQASAGSATFLWKARTGYDVYATTTVSPVGTPRPFEVEQPSYPNHESLPAGAQLTALHDDAGRLFWRVIADGYDGVVAQPDLEAVTQLAPVVVTGRRIPRIESTDSLGNALVTQGDAASLTTLAGTTLVATQAGEAFTLGEAASAGARVLVTLARLASMMVVMSRSLRWSNGRWQVTPVRRRQAQRLNRL